MEDIKKWIISLLIGAWATFTEQYAIILALVVCAIVFDIVTGLIKAKAKGEKISSRKGWIGFWKKISLIISFGFGIFLDCFIPYVLKVISITLPFDSPFALIIGVYIIINENISICENLNNINPTILPKWISNLLQGASDKINKGD